MLDLDKLHNHFLDGNIREQASGKTTAVIQQAIGFAEVLENTKIYILCLREDIMHIRRSLYESFIPTSFVPLFDSDNFYIKSNIVKIMTYENYLNKDYMQLNFQDHNHLLLWDFREETSVNNQPETMYKIINQTKGRLVGSAIYEVYKVFGNVNIEII
jgi:hypothetical protein